MHLDLLLLTYSHVPNRLNEVLHLFEKDKEIVALSEKKVVAKLRQLLIKQSL
jgi:hypothetical protein